MYQWTTKNFVLPDPKVGKSTVGPRTSYQCEHLPGITILQFVGHLFSGFMVGLMGTSSRSAYGLPRSAAPRASAPVAGHCWPMCPQETQKLKQETFKHSKK